MCKLAIRLLFPMFPVIQATLQLVSARIYQFVVSAWKRHARAKYRVPRCPEQLKPHNISKVQWKKCNKNQAHMKSPQAQTKNKTPEVFFQPCQTQVVPNMFISYIEGSKMDWTVNDGLYHGFLKWHLKCENILECGLAMLPEKR